MAIKTTLVTIWKNRRHFKLQIFGITVLTVVCIFIANLVSIKISYDKKLNNYLSSTSKYTSSFQMSLSGVKGTVDNVYVDNSKTQCFILAKLANTASLTMVANNYQMFVSNVNYDGSNAGTPEENFTGEIYMFGSTGIVGLYIKSDVPFENTMKQLTLRSYTKYTANTSPYFRTTATDAQYDQCHIFFNPGATDTKTIDFLENHVAGTDFDLSGVYRQVNSVNKETEIRNNILQYYDDLIAVMNKIMEYQNRLENAYNVDIPELPKYIKGDYFDDVAIYDAEGVQIGSYRKYIPATIVPGGTEYDWYNGNIMEGYFKLVPNTKKMTVRDYIYALNTDKSTRRIPDMYTEEWYYKDGTQVRLKTDSTTTSLELEVIENIKLYENQLDKYIELKKTYQTEYLTDLLLLESDSATVGQVYSVRKDENAILKY